MSYLLEQNNIHLNSQKEIAFQPQLSGVAELGGPGGPVPPHFFGKLVNKASLGPPLFQGYNYVVPLHYLTHFATPVWYLSFSGTKNVIDEGMYLFPNQNKKFLYTVPKYLEDVHY